jgi:predicted DNA-binding transcriptional regulator AlpA
VCDCMGRIVDDDSATLTGNNLALGEHFVDAAKVADFLSVSRKHVLRLSKLGRIPAHPISFGERNTWRYLLSEVRAWMLQRDSSLGVGQTLPSRIQLRPGSPRKGG